MFTRIAAFASVLALLGAVRADPSPLTPDGSVVFKAGGDCTIVWGLDTTGTWKDMEIEFMSGDNYDMKHITTVGKVDATTTTSFTWTCPEVNPYSKIYFYQMSSAANPGKLQWTTRFAISDKDGNTVPPANDVQPGSGDKIPWGVGTLVDASSATPAPAYLAVTDDSSSGAASGSSSASASASGSASGTASATLSASSGMVTKSSSISASGSKAAASGSSSAAAASGSAAAGESSGAMGVQVPVLALGAVLAALGFAL